MRRFIIEVIIFSAICGAGIFSVFTIANGKSDAFYIKFTTPKQQSFILGTSKSAQDLQPEIFNNIIYPNQERKMYNYSFSLEDSPYGPSYLKSIEMKLDPETKDGIFLVTVDPWSIASDSDKPDIYQNLSEKNGRLDKTYNVTMNPNLFYLINAYSSSYFQILVNLKEKRHFLKKDGWLEIRVPMDSASIKKRTIEKVTHYKTAMLSQSKFSTIRLEYLSKTIEFLQKHGTVYLVRLPVTEEIFVVEELFMPDFDGKMEQLSYKYNVLYLNYRNLPHVYDYTDGNHLYNTSGAVVSEEIARWILENQTNELGK